MFAAGCGRSSTSLLPPPPPSANTAVTLLLSSTANDQLSQFPINLNSLTLTSKSGKKVSLFSAEQNPEFIHSIYSPATTLTLIPQSIDGSVNGAGTEG